LREKAYARFLARALEKKACREGYRRFYIGLPKPLYELAFAKADIGYPKTMKKMFKPWLLVRDDFRLDAINALGKKRLPRGDRRPPTH
jgi:hypothetical protein